MKIRTIISWISCIIVGLIMIAGGTGKLFGYGELPGQSIEFLHLIVPAFIGTPAFYEFVGTVLFPYVLPWVETILGLMLIIGFAPRLVATLSLPLSTAFLANNIWSISKGMDRFPDCACFGIWEEIFGVLTPFQSMFIDIGLIILAVTIITVHPGAYLVSRPWLTRWFAAGKTAKEIK